MSHIRNVRKSLVSPLESYYGSPSSGATLVHPGFFPSEFENIGINKRGANRNEYYGFVVTKPFNVNNKLVFGFSYLDTKDNQEDEDIYVLDLVKLEMEFFPKGSYEKENDLYKDTHKGLKDFFAKMGSKL